MKFIWFFVVLGLFVVLVLSGCVSQDSDSKQIDSDSQNKSDVTVSNSTVSSSTTVQEKMKHCLLQIGTMEFHYYVAQDKVYMQTLDTTDNIYTEQVITKTETCAKTVDGVKGCYPNTEEDFQFVYDEAMSGNCNEVDYNALVFNIK